VKKIYILILMILLSCLAVSTGWAATTPDAPSGLTATAASSTEIDLIWEDNSNNEAGFKIQRKESGGSYSLIDAVRANRTSYTDSGLAAETKYYYRIWAYNSVGDSVYSNEDYAITRSLSVPSAPSNLEITNITSSEIEIAWEDNSDDETGFKIERKKSGGSYSQIASVDENTTNYTATGLSDGTIYSFRVRAYNDAGYSSYSNVVSDTTGGTPDAPSSLEATAVSSSKIKLTWEDNSDNETGFKIDRKKSGGSYSQIASVDENANTYTDTGLTGNTKYYYRIRAYNDTGNSAYSSETYVTTSGIETTIKMVVGNTSYYVNNQLKTMDTAPIIQESRTLLPIRFVSEAIGAKVIWSNNERKVTITLEGTTIELWIGVSYARVNGEYKIIDSTNTAVTPIIVEPGRTMLPLRFVSENLDSQVDWNSSKKEVTVTYPAP
jgi:transcriptional regulator CtsR